MKIGFVSLGCPKNLVDSEVMLGWPSRPGTRSPPTRRAPTCWSSTPAPSSTAPSRSRSTPSSRWPSSRSTAAGRGSSSPAAWPSGIATSCRTEIPEIDAVLGTGEVPEIVAAMSSGSGSRRAGNRRRPMHVLPTRPGCPAPGVPDPGAPRLRRRPPDVPLRRRPRRACCVTPRHYAYVKIAEGCDYTCAFCIIPTLRGHYRSRAVESIVTRGAGSWRRAASRNCCSSRRTRPSTASTAASAARWPGCCGALNDVDGPRVDSAALPLPDHDHRRRARRDGRAATRSCKYIDLPLQHASDAVLKRMRRPGTRATLRARCSHGIRARDARRDAAHHVHRRAFPGETEADVRRARRVRRRRSASTTSASSPTPTRKARAAYALADDVPARRPRRPRQRPR